MKPFYASALLFLTVCSLFVVADTPYPQHRATIANYQSASFGSFGSMRH